MVSSWLLAAWAASTVMATRPSREAPYFRDFFYVGGGYVDNGSGEHIFRDQMYVERLEPVHGVTQASPIVMIHGQAQTGTNFLNKPDGGTGWASRYLQQGFEVYIVDQTFRGRSAWAPGVGRPTPATYSAELISKRFTAVQDYNLWPQARLHTQWPDDGKIGSEVFDAFYSSNVQFISNATYQQSTVQAAGAQLLDRIGKPVVLLGHSQGTLMPLLIADARPKLTKAIILIEPTGPPFQEAVFGSAPARPYGLTDIPLTYSPAVTNPATDLVQQTYPPPVANTDNSTVPCVLQAKNPSPRQLPNLSPLPILVVTGEASYHAPYDYCTVEYLKQAGCASTKHLPLSSVGVKGNGHMMFLEKNSDEIWKHIQEWVQLAGHLLDHRYRILIGLTYLAIIGWLKPLRISKISQPRRCVVYSSADALFIITQTIPDAQHALQTFPSKSSFQVDLVRLQIDEYIPVNHVCLHSSRPKNGVQV